MALKSPVYWCNGAMDESEEQAFVAACFDVAVKVGPGLGSTSMQIVRDAKIKKTNGNGGNLYGDTFMAVAGLVEMLVEPYDNMTRGCKEPMRILHETMSMPMVMKRIAGKIGSIGRSTVAVENDYKTFEQATGTMILLVYVGSMVI